MLFLISQLSNFNYKSFLINFDKTLNCLKSLTLIIYYIISFVFYNFFIYLIKFKLITRIINSFKDFLIALEITRNDSFKDFSLLISISFNL